MQVETDPVDRLDHPVVGKELGFEVLDLQDRRRHRFCLGSRASRRPSPRKLNAISVNDSAMAGTRTTCGAMRMAWNPSAAIAPQDVVGGWTPRPRKLKKASKRMACGTPKVAWTMIGPNALGRMWRDRVLFGRGPEARAAPTNSRARRGKRWPRPRRATSIPRGNALGEMISFRP